MTRLTFDAPRPSGEPAEITLAQNDCMLALLELDPGSVDVVTTSPPYNLGVEYDGYDDSIPRADYLAWTRRWLALVRQVLSDDGSLFLNMGGKAKDPWGPYEVLAIAREEGYVLQNEILWVKSISAPDEVTGEYVTKGHSKPINSNKFLTRTAEFVFHLTKTGDVLLNKLDPLLTVPFADKSNMRRGNRGANGDARNPGNVWVLSYKTIKNADEDRGHPAPYPPELAERCMALHGRDRIRLSLDPFSGVGNSAIAAARLGVNHLSVELSQAYHARAASELRRLGLKERVPA